VCVCVCVCVCVQVEDQVERLTTDLYLTKHRLQATEEEKRGKDEEAAVVSLSSRLHVFHDTLLLRTPPPKGRLLFSQSKEVFRRELDKVEHEVRRSSGVIADYKQVGRLRETFARSVTTET